MATLGGRYRRVNCCGDKFGDKVDSCRSTGCRVAVTKVLAGLGAFVLPSSQASDDDVEQSDIASPSARNAPLDDPAALLRRNRKAWRFARSGPDDTTSGGAFLSMPCLCSRFPASGRAIGGERTIRAARLKCLKHSYRSPYEIPRFQKFQPPLQSGPTPVIPTTPRQSHFVPSSAQVALAEGERLFSSPEEVRQ